MKMQDIFVITKVLYTFLFRSQYLGGDTGVLLLLWIRLWVHFPSMNPHNFTVNSYCVHLKPWTPSILFSVYIRLFCDIFFWMDIMNNNNYHEFCQSVLLFVIDGHCICCWDIGWYVNMFACILSKCLHFCDFVFSVFSSFELLPSCHL